jgi:hypothetical protein
MSSSAGRARQRLQHEPQGQLLGQRGCVTVLPEPEDGARMAAKEPTLNEEEIMLLAGHSSSNMTNAYYGDRN